MAGSGVSEEALALNLQQRERVDPQTGCTVVVPALVCIYKGHNGESYIPVHVIPPPSTHLGVRTSIFSVTYRPKRMMTQHSGWRHLS